jgi:hypothetical protein
MRWRGSWASRASCRNVPSCPQAPGGGEAAQRATDAQQSKPAALRPSSPGGRRWAGGLPVECVRPKGGEAKNAAGRGPVWLGPKLSGRSGGRNDRPRWLGPSMVAARSLLTFVYEDSVVVLTDAEALAS